ncbi:MAG: ankyrin repeat domain-containing protein [Alphaproteobacteria bacterium]|jgi:ankyrin repeat protein|nr:ankyrin repeat domain-containing protein [Candidatus Jidaibacter sp.]
MWEHEFEYDDNKTPLHWAAAIGNTETIEEILKDGNIALDARDKYGWTALHYASANSNISAMNTLLKNGASLNIENNHGRSALCEAIQSADDETLNLLMQSYIKMHNMSETNVYTPLHIAVLYDNIQIASYFLQNNQAIIDLGCASRQATPLHYAVANMHLEMMNFLLWCNASVHVVDLDNSTPLHIAANVKNTHGIHALLKKGALINAFDNYGQTPIHRAVLANSTSAIKIFGRNKVDLDIMNKNGETALHLAVSETKPRICKILISLGANINAQDKDGYTPLHLAALRGNHDLIKLLLSNTNINPFILDNEGKDAESLCTTKYLNYAISDYQGAYTQKLSDNATDIIIDTRSHILHSHIKDNANTDNVNLSK